MTVEEMDRRRFLSLGAGMAGAIALGAGLAGCSSSSKSGSAASSTSAAQTSSAAQSSAASAAPSSAGSSASAALAGYQKDGLKLVYITNPPFSYADPKSGEIIGAGPVVLRELLKPYGITKFSYSLVQFAGEIPAVSSKRADMTANNFNANADRCAQVGFTNPVALYHQGALVHKGNPKNLHSYDDIAKDSSVKIAILRGDASIAWLQSYGVGTNRLLQFDALPQAVTAVNQGRADVYLNATVSLNQELKQPEASNLEVANPFKGPVINGKELITNASYAIRYEEVDLLNALNEQIAALINNGRMLELLTPYGYDKDSIPPATMTAKSICPAAPWPAGYKDLSS
jgi:polar amino acid transport system substrate-binding protein